MPLYESQRAAEMLETVYKESQKDVILATKLSCIAKIHGSL